jgi:hypothetical protein
VVVIDADAEKGETAFAGRKKRVHTMEGEEKGVERKLKRNEGEWEQ